MLLVRTDDSYLMVSFLCFVGMATAKLNRAKLKKMMMSQQDEAPLVIGKKRKVDSSSKRATDERSLPPPPPVQKPSVPEPVPTSSVEVVEISAEPTSSRPVEKAPTLPRDASLACRRAKSVVTKDDVSEYDKVNTDVVKVAGVHSLMKVWSLHSPQSLICYVLQGLTDRYFSCCRA
jgi:hypothetical protein